LVVAYAKALIVFVSYWWAASPIISMLFVNLIFTCLLLFETLARPWAVSEETKSAPNKHARRRRRSIVQMLEENVVNTIKELNLSQFSCMSMFLCSLTGWTGLYFELSPQCQHGGNAGVCTFVTVAIISLHIAFFIWVSN